MGNADYHITKIWRSRAEETKPEHAGVPANTVRKEGTFVYRFIVLFFGRATIGSRLVFLSAEVGVGLALKSDKIAGAFENKCPCKDFLLRNH